jgi:hypothetical protein
MTPIASRAKTPAEPARRNALRLLRPTPYGPERQRSRPIRQSAHDVFDVVTTAPARFRGGILGVSDLRNRYNRSDRGNEAFVMLMRAKGENHSRSRVFTRTHMAVALGGR